MSTNETEETVTAKTYIPPNQKQHWQDHADELNMNQSEFIRTMVQAGRKNFEIDCETSPDTDATPGGQGLEETILDLLETDEVLEWGELLSELTDSVESELETTLDALQEENRIKYSGRHNGYILNGNQ